MALFKKKETAPPSDPKKKVTPDTEATHRKPEKQGSGEKKKKGWGKAIAMGVAAIILAGSGFFVYHFFFHANRYRERPLEKVTIGKELVEFTFHHLPDLYHMLVETNDKERLIGKEVERLMKIAENFPAQRAVVEAEMTTLKTVGENLKMLREELEKNIEMIYVSFHVNQEKGLRLIETNNDLLATKAGEKLASYTSLFERVSAQQQTQGVLSRLTPSFLKKKL